MQSATSCRFWQAVSGAVVLAGIVTIAPAAHADSALGPEASATDAAAPAADILVTARQRPEPAQTVPAALGVVSAPGSTVRWPSTPRR
jgi:iron complex outermembrane receptor protein